MNLIIFNIEATNRKHSLTPRNIVTPAFIDIMLMITYIYSKFHKCFSIKIFSSNIEINSWFIAVFKNNIKFKLLRFAKGMFPVGKVFLLHVIYKMQNLRIIKIVIFLLMKTTTMIPCRRVTQRELAVTTTSDFGFIVVCFTKKKRTLELCKHS